MAEIRKETRQTWGKCEKRNSRFRTAEVQAVGRRNSSGSRWASTGKGEDEK